MLAAIWVICQLDAGRLKLTERPMLAVGHYFCALSFLTVASAARCGEWHLLNSLPSDGDAVCECDSIDETLLDGRELQSEIASDCCFDRFISPLSNPFYFEDPRSITEIRGMFLNNALPVRMGGGDVDVWAAQIRVRVAERWSLIAPRIGFMKINQGSEDDEEGPREGFMAAPIGFKYNLVRDVDRQLLISLGTTYISTNVRRSFGGVNQNSTTPSTASVARPNCF